MERGALGQGSGSSEFVVTVGICGQELPQVRFAQNHHMDQAHAPNRADEPFAPAPMWYFWSMACSG